MAADTAARMRKRYDLEDPASPSWRAHRKHVFVLSSAGKPIFSRFGDESKLAALAGVLQALISVVQSNGDEIQNARVGNHNIVFLVRGPLYLVAASCCGDTVAYLSAQLHMLHSQLISILTSKVEEVFLRNAAFDLRSLLGGTDHLVRTLIRQAASSPAFLLNAVPSARMPPSVRADLTRLLLAARPSTLLFALLLSRGTLVATLRSKHASLQPTDTLLVMNAVAASSSDAGQFREDQSWLPICLPQHDARGFVYAHISFVTEELCLVLLSPDREAFPQLSEHRDAIVDKISASLSPSLTEALASPLPPLPPANPEIFHFVYKLHATGQYTSPRIPCSSPYAQRGALKRLLRQYQLAHARVHVSYQPGKPPRIGRLCRCRRRRPALVPAHNHPPFPLICRPCRTVSFRWQVCARVHSGKRLGDDCGVVQPRV